MMIPADNKSLGCSQNPLNTLHTSCIPYCSVPENIHTHPMEGQIMGLNWNFPEGWGDLNQKTLCGGHGYISIFWNNNTFLIKLPGTRRIVHWLNVTSCVAYIVVILANTIHYS